MNRLWLMIEGGLGARRVFTNERTLYAWMDGKVQQYMLVVLMDWVRKSEPGNWTTCGDRVFVCVAHLRPKHGAQDDRVVVEHQAWEDRLIGQNQQLESDVAVLREALSVAGRCIKELDGYGKPRPTSPSVETVLNAIRAALEATS